MATLAARQHGVVSTAQLRALSLGDKAVAHAVAVGLLHRVYRGVYAVGHTRLSREGRWLAAVLACGPGAVLSHRSAAALWGFRPTARGAIDVTASRGHKPKRGIDVHRVRRLDPADTTTYDAIPVTTPMRTLVDLADVLDEARLAKAIHEAEVRRLLDTAELRRATMAANGRRGIGKLKRLSLVSDVPGTRSELEDRFLALCATAGLPRPRVNATVACFEVDFLWPDARLVVETDGAATHLTAKAFEADRRRDAALTVAGYRVVRFTWRQVTEAPADVVAVLRRLV